MILKIGSIQFAENLLKNACEKPNIDLGDHRHRLFEIAEMQLYFGSHKGYILKKVGNVTDENMWMAELKDRYIKDIGRVPAVFPRSREEKRKDDILCHGMGGTDIWMWAWRLDLFGPFSSSP